MSAPWFTLPGTWSPSVSTYCSELTQEGHSPACRVAFETRPPWWFMYYIYIYAFSRHFYTKRLTVHSGYTFLCVFPGNRTHNLCAANAMLYHWATATLYDTMDLLSERTSTWCTRMSGRKNWQAWHNASIFRQLMCRPDCSSDQRPKVSLTLHSTPQPLLEVSAVTTFLLCAVSRVTPCFSQKGSLQENGRARGAESLSEKKAIRECREARLKLSQWEQSTGWISPSMTRTQRESHQRAGEICTSHNDGVGFATTLWNLLF